MNDLTAGPIPEGYTRVAGAADFLGIGRTLPMKAGSFSIDLYDGTHAKDDGEGNIFIGDDCVGKVNYVTGHYSFLKRTRTA